MTEPLDSEVSLAQAEFFRALGPERRERLAPFVRERRFVRGRALFREGRPAECLWVVHRGEVRLYKASGSGRVTTLDILRPGEMFGAVSALDREDYIVSAEAIRHGTAWCLSRAKMLQIVSETPAVAIEILVVTSRRLREAHERIRSFAHDPAPARLAQALLRSVQEGEAHVTRRALAEEAGTTVETAIRVLRRFEREGVVCGAVGLIRVENESALRAIAEGHEAR